MPTASMRRSVVLLWLVMMAGGMRRSASPQLASEDDMMEYHSGMERELPQRFGVMFRDLLTWGIGGSSTYRRRGICD